MNSEMKTTRTLHRFMTRALAAALVAWSASVAYAQSVEPGRSGMADGIGVHGYWIIDVRNPDGTLVSHTEFENDLQQEGKVALVKVLQGGSVFRFVYVELDGPGNQPCSKVIAGSVVGSPCFLVPPENPFGGPDYPATNTFPNLASALQSQPSGALVLTGSATASLNGFIGTVRTRALSECRPAGLPVPCDRFPYFTPFTAFVLTPDPNDPGPPPIPISVGQVIQVTVRLSFS